MRNDMQTAPYSLHFFPKSNRPQSISSGGPSAYDRQRRKAMYSEQNKHCRECICPSCDLFQTDECLEGVDGCEKCDNSSYHIGHCWWHPDEREGGHV